jgi:ribosomal protein S10
VAVAYLTPLRRRAEYGVPSCDLQLRSYSIRNVEFMADFAMRAAYYLGLPASGPVPLPKIIERWTVPRSNFVHKKSQENFERITRRRLVQIQDGHPETVQVWLAFLRKHAFYGVGMKANVWQHEALGKFVHCAFSAENRAWLTCDPFTEVGKNMDRAFAEVEKELDAKLATFGWNKSVASTQSVTEMLQKQGVKQVGVPLTDVREASQTRDQRI